MSLKVRRTTAQAVAAALGLSVTGCAYLQSPYDDEPKYRRGEKPSYTMALITNINESDCQKGQTGVQCTPVGKLILTKPSENLSIQIYRPATNGTAQVVTCVSPAEAGKSISTDSAFSASLPVRTAGAVAQATAAASAATTESLVVLKSIDAASQYVATASFANCLAYASGMYDAMAAEKLQGQIFGNAVSIAASAPR